MPGRGRNYVMPLAKKCGQCGKVKPMDGFYRRGDRAGGRASKCKTCVADLNAGRVRGIWAPKTPETMRRLNLRRYGLTPERWEEVLAAQGGACAICAGPALGKGRYHVDHIHGTKYVRGLLCHKCNVALGMVQDSPVLLRRLADYLEHHAHVSSVSTAAPEPSTSQMPSTTPR